MDTNDWLKKQLQFLPKKLPVIIHHSRELMLDVVDDVTGETYSTSLRQHLLELIIQLNINKAENTLFEQFEKISDSQIVEVSNWFYNKLDALPDSDLQKADFSKEEITAGRDDVKRIITSTS